MRLGRIGFDRVAGYLKDGLQSLQSRPDLVATTERVSAVVASERIGSERPLVIDVRTAQERREKYIAPSVHIPLNHLSERMAEIPKDTPLLLYCAGGYRSSVAASLLEQRGFTRLGEIAGGLAAWEAAQLPVAPEAGTSEGVV